MRSSTPATVGSWRSSGPRRPPRRSDESQATARRWSPPAVNRSSATRTRPVPVPARRSPRRSAPTPTSRPRSDSIQGPPRLRRVCRSPARARPRPQPGHLPRCAGRRMALRLWLGSEIYAGEFVHGHEQTALHQRVAEIGTISEFLRWFDAVHAGDSSARPYVGTSVTLDGRLQLSVDVNGTTAGRRGIPALLVGLQPFIVGLVEPTEPPPPRLAATPPAVARHGQDLAGRRLGQGYGGGRAKAVSWSTDLQPVKPPLIVARADVWLRSSRRRRITPPWPPSIALLKTVSLETFAPYTADRCVRQTRSRPTRFTTPLLSPLIALVPCLWCLAALKVRTAQRPGLRRLRSPRPLACRRRRWGRQRSCRF